MLIITDYNQFLLIKIVKPYKCLCMGMLCASRLWSRLCGSCTAFRYFSGCRTGPCDIAVRVYMFICRLHTQKTHRQDVQTGKIGTDRFQTDKVQTDKMQTLRVHTVQVLIDKVNEDRVQTASVPTGQVQTDSVQTDGYQTDTQKA